MSTHDYYKRLRTQLEIILVMLGSVLSTEESSEVGRSSSKAAEARWAKKGQRGERS